MACDLIDSKVIVLLFWITSTLYHGRFCSGLRCPSRARCVRQGVSGTIPSHQEASGDAKSSFEAILTRQRSSKPALPDANGSWTELTDPVDEKIFSTTIRGENVTCYGASPANDGAHYPRDSPNLSAT